MAIEFVLKGLEVDSILNGTVRLHLNNKELAKDIHNNRKDFSGYHVKIWKPKEKSQTANSYMWQLCTLIAQKRKENSPGETYTKEDVYREAIREAGKWEDVIMADYTQEKFDAFAKEFKGTHEGQFVEVFSVKGKWTLLRCYYGSEGYDQYELSHVIDYVVRLALDEGVDPDTPGDRQRLLNLMKG